MTKLNKIRNVLGITRGDDPVEAVANLQRRFQANLQHCHELDVRMLAQTDTNAALTSQVVSLQIKLDALQAQVKVGDRRITPNLGTTVTVVAIDGDSASVRFDNANNPERPNRWYSLRRVATWEFADEQGYGEDEDGLL